MGASAVFMTDIVDSRLNLGKTLGADHVLNVKDMKAEDVARKVVSDLGVQPDAAIECTGAATSIETGIYVRFISLLFMVLFGKLLNRYSLAGKIRTAS